MKKILLCNVIIVLAFLLYSCKDANETSGGKTDTTAVSTTTTSPSTENKTEGSNATGGATDLRTQTAVETPEGIRIQFAEGAVEATVTGSIKGYGDNITYIFEAREGQVLTASVVAKESNANVRINQIISPSGNADGPFGNTMDYKLNQTGDWKLILGEDQMAGEPWEGNYTLTIEIK